jgi:hypothetical protein
LLLDWWRSYRSDDDAAVDLGGVASQLKAACIRIAREEAYSYHLWHGKSDSRAWARWATDLGGGKKAFAFTPSLDAGRELTARDPYNRDIAFVILVSVDVPDDDIAKAVGTHHSGFSFCGCQPLDGALKENIFAELRGAVRCYTPPSLPFDEKAILQLAHR